MQQEKLSRASTAHSSEKVPFEAEPVSACLPARPTAWHLTLDAQIATENAARCTAQLRGRQFSDRRTEHVSGPSSGVRKLKRFFLVSIPFHISDKIDQIGVDGNFMNCQQRSLLKVKFRAPDNVW